MWFFSFSFLKFFCDFFLKKLWLYPPDEDIAHMIHRMEKSIWYWPQISSDSHSIQWCCECSNKEKKSAVPSIIKAYKQHQWSWHYIIKGAIMTHILGSQDNCLFALKTLTVWYYIPCRMSAAFKVIDPRMILKTASFY